jgi:hypothetical protein
MPSLRSQMKKDFDRVKWNIDHITNTKLSNPMSPKDYVAYKDLIPSILNLPKRAYDLKGYEDFGANWITEKNERKIFIVVLLVTAAILSFIL